VTLSFPVYLMLASSRMLWRTQFLSGVGAALVFTALCGFATHVFRRESAKGALFLTLGGVIVFYGSVSAIQKSAFHRSRWDLHRNAMEEILRVAPSVRPNTVVVLKNVPQSGDPFGHNMWLDLSVRLAYPGIPVAATYFYEDGTSGPGANLKAAGNEWKWDGTGIAPIVRATSLANTIVVDYQLSGRGKLGAAFPAYMCPTSCAMELYRPDFVITGPVSPIARRRYRIN